MRSKYIIFKNEKNTTLYHPKFIKVKKMFGKHGEGSNDIHLSCFQLSIADLYGEQKAHRAINSQVILVLY